MIGRTSITAVLVLTCSIGFGSLTCQGSMPSQLSSRERQIAHLIARGMTNGEIADDLGISPLTVKWHVSEMLRKIGVRGRLQLALHVRGLDDTHPTAG